MKRTDLGVLLFLLGGRRSGSSQTGLLLLLRLGAILVQQLKQLRSSVFIQRVRELGNGRWDLETLVQNHFLPLEADVFRPFDETGEVSLGPDVLACTWFKLSVENINRETTTR